MSTYVDLCRPKKLFPGRAPSTTTKARQHLSKLKTRNCRLLRLDTPLTAVDYSLLRLDTPLTTVDYGLLRQDTAPNRSQPHPTAANRA